LGEFAGPFSKVQKSSRIQEFFKLKDETDRLSQKVGNKLPPLAAQKHRTAQFSRKVLLSWKVKIYHFV
jgi:hypothetical protein